MITFVTGGEPYHTLSLGALQIRARESVALLGSSTAEARVLLTLIAEQRMLKRSTLQKLSPAELTGVRPVAGEGAATTVSLLLLDEPLEGLSLAEAAETADRLRALSACGSTLVVATRYLAIAADLAARTIVLDAEQIVGDLSTTELLRHLRAEMYELRLRGHLPPDWTDFFAGLTLINLPSGECLLRGQVRDQAALHGLIATARALGLELSSITRIDPSIEEVIRRLDL